MLDWYFHILNILLTDSSFGYLGENLIFLDKNAKAFDKLTFTVKGDANIVAVDNGNILSDELHIGKTQLEKKISAISSRVPPSWYCVPVLSLER